VWYYNLIIYTVGGFLVDYLGFPRASSYFGLSLLSISIIYLFFGGFCAKQRGKNIADIPRIHSRIGNLAKSFASNKGTSFLLK